jgi:hypothetical protein
MNIPLAAMQTGTGIILCGFLFGFYILLDISMCNTLFINIAW